MKNLQMNNELTPDESFTGKLRWLEEPGKVALQQEVRVRIHKYNDDSSQTQDTTYVEWRDVPCELVEK
jgi:hypothetical protein